jgi:uncharacterized protein (DUF1697 family)
VATHDHVIGPTKGLWTRMNGEGSVTRATAIHTPVPMYVALLRGINVGGKNLIKMPALKAAFEADGYEDVATYIQSGNVLFRTASTGSAALTTRIEDMLSATFDYRASVVVRSQAQLRAVVQGAPKGFGADPATYLYEVLFLKEPLRAETAVKSVSTKEGVDRVWAGGGVLYASRLRSRAVQSRLNRIASMPIYQSMTIRNWNTTSSLLRRMDEASRTPPPGRG